MDGKASACVPPLRGRMTIGLCPGAWSGGRKKDGVTVILLWDAGLILDTGT